MDTYMVKMSRMMIALLVWPAQAMLIMEMLVMIELDDDYWYDHDDY